jgi:hypothetical protein
MLRIVRSLVHRSELADGWHEMGKRDLARMADGRMDPTGAADTRRTMG